MIGLAKIPELRNLRKFVSEPFEGRILSVTTDFHHILTTGCNVIQTRMTFSCFQLFLQKDIIYLLYMGKQFRDFEYKLFSSKSIFNYEFGAPCRLLHLGPI